MTFQETRLKVKEIGPLDTPEKFYQAFCLWKDLAFPKPVVTVSIGIQHTMIANYVSMMFHQVDGNTVYTLQVGENQVYEDGKLVKYVPCLFTPDNFVVNGYAPPYRPFQYGGHVEKNFENIDLNNQEQVMSVIREYYDRIADGMDNV